MFDLASMRCRETSRMNRLEGRFRRLYGEAAPRCLERLTMMVGRYGLGTTVKRPLERWSERDAVLITYADTLQRAGEKPLVTLREFLRQRLSGALNTVHVLPFFPYSSDDGFSIIDYRQVRPELGKWSDVTRLGQDFQLMVDVVLNHVSRQSEWFNDYVRGIAPARDFFIEADPDCDLSAVVRPRESDLLTPVETRDGTKHLWTTFSADQIDLNFANPDVLFEFLDVILFYVAQGARIIRLDAIAYLWKKIGTSCIHLPETHEVVKLIRDFLEMVAPHVLIITETNVPPEENVSYFGYGDEAHVVYQFTLPPLLLYCLQSGRAERLTHWAAGLPGPPPGCTFLNFTASHDGIGVRPLEGIIASSELTGLVAGIARRGGQVSRKTNPDGSSSPYELNITYLDALADPARPDEEEHLRRFLCSQAVALALQGIPAVYIHSLLGTRNDYEQVRRTGSARSINRHQWDAAALEEVWADPTSLGARVFTAYVKLLQVRTGQAAFHPDGRQKVWELDQRVFALERRAPDGGATVLALHNFSRDAVGLQIDPRLPGASGPRLWRDLLDGQEHDITQPLRLAGYQVMWLSAGPVG